VHDRRGLFCFAITAFPGTGKQDEERVMHGDALKSLFILRPKENSIDWLAQCGALACARYAPDAPDSLPL
jgi:hypothetical protein